MPLPGRTARKAGGVAGGPYRRYPLVDAAMRRLQRCGWMHNRLRMVVYVIPDQDLGIDWRLGERHFAEQLNDFDLSANNGGWQWARIDGLRRNPRLLSDLQPGDPIGEVRSEGKRSPSLRTGTGQPGEPADPQPVADVHENAQGSRRGDHRP